MLDAVRYLVVWNPVIFMAVSVLFHLFAPHPHHPHAHPATLLGITGVNGTNLTNSTHSPLAMLAGAHSPISGANALAH